jgi:hypothetical protein
MDFISVKEAAKRWSVSERRVQLLCQQRRIPGLVRFGKMWMIPGQSAKPLDPRSHKAS